jgi:hypothetical protein
LVDIDELTDIFPEDFVLNNERNSQRGWTGVLGGEAASPNLMSDWSSIEVMIAINYRGKRVGRESDELV